MNKYEECLFYYIMEHEWPDLLEQEAYQVLAESRDEALNALTETFTPEQRELYETLEEVRARRDLREQGAVFRAGVLLGGGLAAEILSK